MLSPVGRVVSRAFNTPDEALIIQLERELFDALREKDIVKLDRLLPDDFSYRSPYSRDLAKHEFLALVQAFPPRITRVWAGELKVTFYGQTAVLNGVQTARLVNHKGKATMSSIAFTDVFVQRRGRWCLVSSYGSEATERGA